MSPGFTDIPIFPDRNIIAKMAEIVPLKRFATPEEIADAVIFLTTNQYITGLDLLIDGGVSTIRPEFRL
ncbi:MAG TPA: SDR family oxidoreductase [Candidatus Berkiella sp.]|nr:SDR family oxidoreductase [Candidatus Berkiella sp.]